jgi:acetyl esterase
MSTAESTRLMNLDPDIGAFLQKLEAQGGPPLYTLSPKDAREVLVKVQQSVKAPMPPADIEERVINGPTGQISLHIIRPQGVKATLPVVLYMHGGGWILGDAFTHDRLIRELANGAQAAVVFVDFSRSPEAHYPIALEEAYATLKWIAEQGASANLDGSRLAVAGDSVGGNMSAALTMLAKTRGGPKINFQALFYPVTDISGFDTASYRQFGDGGYWLTREAMKWFAESYAPDTKTRNEPTVSPLRATHEQLQGLPPALILTAECDVLRDEGEAYAHKLMTAGVRVTATRYLGAIHDFMMLNPVAHTPPARGAITEASAVLWNTLGRQAAAAGV